ncbi:hypothetical protein D3C74_39790 [compost metagenome]
MEGKFGTGGATATAFVSGFLRLQAVYMKEIWRQQRPEVQTFTAVARTRTLNIFSSIYIVSHSIITLQLF